jgi:hypothetical protein
LLLKSVLFFPEHNELLELFSEVLGILQEFMVKKLLGGPSVGGVFAQAFGNKVLEAG